MPQPEMSWYEQPAGRTAVITELKAPAEMVEIIQDLLDPDRCTFDHHGYCQAHGWFETDPKCPHARGKDLLARLGAR